MTVYNSCGHVEFSVDKRITSHENEIITMDFVNIYRLLRSRKINLHFNHTNDHELLSNQFLITPACRSLR